MQLGLPVELAKCNVPFYLLGRSQRNQIALVLWNASEPPSPFAFFKVFFIFCHHAALCQLQWLLSLNNLIDEFLLFRLLSFPSLAGAFCHSCLPFRAAFLASSDNVEESSLCRGKTHTHTHTLALARQLFKTMERCLSWLVSKLSATAWFCIHVRIRSCSMFCVQVHTCVSLGWSHDLGFLAATHKGVWKHVFRLEETAEMIRQRLSKSCFRSGTEH